MSSPLNASTENKNSENSCGSVKCVTNSTSGPSIDRGKQSYTKPQIHTSKCRQMQQCRFDKLNQYLHLNNENFVPHGQPNHDKLFKVLRFLDAVLKNFCEGYHHKHNLSVGEAMVAFKGQLSMKQYLPMKPVKRGIKIWEYANSSNPSSKHYEWEEPVLFSNTPHTQAQECGYRQCSFWNFMS